MANSMFIPLLRLPQTLQEIREITEEAFTDVGCSRPIIEFGKSSGDINKLLEDFIQIKGNKSNEQCWISISESSPEITENENCKYMASVTTRTNWIFAGIVSYAICRAWGTVVFNDARELDGQERYSAESLRKVICEALHRSQSTSPSDAFLRHTP